MIYLISKFRYIFNHGIDLDNKAKYNKRFKRYMNYRDIVEILFMRFPDLEKAYNLKEKYISFNENIKGNKEEELADLIHEFGESNIKEYDEFYNLLINWKCEIVNSFIIYNNRRINNSFIESRNAEIEKLMYMANGFKNFSRTRNRILYCLNKKDNYSI